MYNDLNREKFEGKSDLKISGSGSYGGGIYHSVKISGVATINGDIECIDMHTSGTSKVSGNITAEEVTTSGVSKVNGNVIGGLVKTSGTSKIEGNVDAMELKTSGTTKVHGDVKAESTNISGSLNIEGSIHSENIIISGHMNVSKDCETERIEASGGFTVGGLLNADNVKIKLGGRSTVKEIGGEKIEVRRWKNWGMFDLHSLVKAIFNYEVKLNCQSIEGDEIYLEYTNADVVRGKDITIGSECEIGVVEYSGTLNIIDGGLVKEQRRI